MQEATNQVSGVVITIVILAGILAIGTWLFGENGPAKDWITDLFESNLIEE